MAAPDRISASEIAFNCALALAMTTWAGVIANEAFFSGRPLADVSAPAVFPGILCTLLLGLAALLVISTLRRRAKGVIAGSENATSSGAQLRVLGVVGLLIAYAAAIPVAGFYLATPLATVSIAWLAGMRRPLSFVALAFSLTAMLYILFSKVLRVPLPPGITLGWGI